MRLRGFVELVRPAPYISIVENHTDRAIIVVGEDGERPLTEGYWMDNHGNGGHLPSPGLPPPGKGVHLQRFSWPPTNLTQEGQ